MTTDYQLKYRQLRQYILQDAQEIACENNSDWVGHLNLTEISADALAQADSWVRYFGSDWRDMCAHYRRNHTARIELAIWFDASLCGLMLGKVSDGKLAVKIDFLQGATLDHPLSGEVASIAKLVAERFADALGIRRIGIQNPRDDLKDYYRSLGFTEPDPFDPRNNALYKPEED